VSGRTQGGLLVRNGGLRSIVFMAFLLAILACLGSAQGQVDLPDDLEFPDPDNITDDLPDDFPDIPGGGDTPDIPGSDKVPVSKFNDWVVSDDENMTGKTLYMYADIIVQNGGFLEIREVNIIFQSNAQTTYGIRVEPGGMLFIEDCNLTVNHPPIGNPTGYFSIYVEGWFKSVNTVFSRLDGDDDEGGIIFDNFGESSKSEILTSTFFDPKTNHITVLPEAKVLIKGIPSGPNAGDTIFHGGDVGVMAWEPTTILYTRFDKVDYPIVMEVGGSHFFDQLDIDDAEVGITINGSSDEDDIFFRDIRLEDCDVGLHTEIDWEVDLEAFTFIRTPMYMEVGGGIATFMNETIPRSSVRVTGNGVLRQAWFVDIDVRTESGGWPSDDSTLEYWSSDLTIQEEDIAVSRGKVPTLQLAAYDLTSSTNRSYSPYFFRALDQETNSTSRIRKVDIDGYTDLLLTIENIGPRANFTGPDTTVITTNVEFDASGSRDVDGTITAYIWDFGDDTPVRTVVSPIMSHRFLKPGVFTITLYVEDNDGIKNSTTRTIEVDYPLRLRFLPFNVSIPVEQGEVITAFVDNRADTTLEDIRLEVEGTLDNWEFSWNLTGNFTLKAGASVAVGITVTPNETTPYRQQETMRITTANPLHAPEKVVTLQGGRFHNLLVDFPSRSSTSVRPNVPFVYSFNITNGGNTEDTFRFVASRELGPFTTFVGRNITLASGETATTSFTILLDGTLEMNEHGYNLSIKVQSLFNPDVEKIRTWPFFIAYYTNVHIQPYAPTFTIEPGKTLKLPINVTNIGNLEIEVDLWASANRTNPAWTKLGMKSPIFLDTLTASDTVGAQSLTISLEPLDTKKPKLQFVVPDDAPLGTYIFDIQALGGDEVVETRFILVVDETLPVPFGIMTALSMLMVAVSIRRRDGSG